MAALKRFPAALANGIPGIPAATAGGDAGGIPPSSAGSGLPWGDRIPTGRHRQRSDRRTTTHGGRHPAAKTAELAQSRSRGRHRTADSAGRCRRFPGGRRPCVRRRVTLEADETRKGAQGVSRRVEAGRKYGVPDIGVEPHAVRREELIEEPRHSARGRGIPGEQVQQPLKSGSRRRRRRGGGQPL